MSISSNENRAVGTYEVEGGLSGVSEDPYSTPRSRLNTNHPLALFVSTDPTLSLDFLFCSFDFLSLADRNYS